VHIEQWGDPSLPRLLLLHGFMGSSADFHPAIAILNHHFYCICVDLPGHGQTMISDDNFVSTAEQILAIAADCKYLCGYSLGGRIALYLALHYPDRWQKVILESASFGLAHESAQQERRDRDSSIARKLRQPNLDFAAFLQNWYQQTVFTGINTHPDFCQLLEHRSQNHPLELAKSLESLGLGQQPYLGDLVKNNQIPLLLLVGEWDTKFIEIGQALLSFCTTAQLVIVPACSHNIHFQQLDRWLQLVLEFLL
jgi:2-succinyl-6-hydroxy-2,4-cyclohexadiene-1-carboxylate synthase